MHTYMHACVCVRACVRACLCVLYIPTHNRTHKRTHIPSTFLHERVLRSSATRDVAKSFDGENRRKIQSSAERNRIPSQRRFPYSPACSEEVDLTLA